MRKSVHLSLLRLISGQTHGRVSNYPARVLKIVRTSESGYSLMGCLCSLLPHCVS
jgi:hypothetical protein